MNAEILNKVQSIRSQFLDEGFVIKGIFGSYVRDEQKPESDIDILYDLSAEFRRKYKGFQAISRLDAIQEKISKLLGIEVDLVQMQYLSEISAKYILPEVYYVE